jgi:RNA polymerase sigma-70 factor (ECF subfamily)
MQLNVGMLMAAAEEHAGGPGHRVPDLLGMPEAEFIERLRAGDEAAYTTMYTTFQPRLIAIATAYVDRAIAEELTQDVLGFVWEHREEWSIERGVGVYLYATVRNRALKYLRHDRVIARLEHVPDIAEAPPGMGGANENADVRLEREDVRAAVDAALARISDGARTAFLLRWMHELSYPEIAQVMATSEVTARQQVAKARRAVVPVLERLARQ